MADLFSGMGGWIEGLRLAGGGEALGVELSTGPCATAAAAGHRVLQADVSELDPRSWWGVEGLVASPPCQSFSLAGMGEGRKLVGELAQGVRNAFAGRHVTVRQHDSRLVVEPARWVHALRPRWVALEQVPPVLPLWKVYVHELRALGYRAWAGTLNAADYGVPQTRSRALLMATRDRLRLPEPTHAQHALPEGLFGSARQRWVSMAEALGWGLADEPAGTLLATTKEAEGCANPGGPHGLDGGSGSRRRYYRAQRAGRWVSTRGNRGDGFERPGGAGVRVTTKTDSWTTDEPGFASLHLEPWEGLVLQGFRPDYPVQGVSTVQWRQIGNAFPPPMAAALLRALTRPQEDT